MSKNVWQKLLSLLLAFCMVATWGGTIWANAADAPVSGWRIEDTGKFQDLLNREEVKNPETGEAYKATDMVRVSIILEEDGTLAAGFPAEDIAQNKSAQAYRNNLKKGQDKLADNIGKAIGQELDVVCNLTLAANIISANVPYGKISAIEKTSGVAAVVIENTYDAMVAEKNEYAPNMSTSGSQIGSAPAYSAGLTGAGSRVAIIDTGLDVDHISFDSGAFLYSLAQQAEKLGMEPDAYIESLDLLDTEEIIAALPYLNIGAIFENAGFDLATYGEMLAETMTYGEKIPFGFNYVDLSFDVTHLNDTEGEHGSHVAGIATANAYVPTADGYASALETVLTQGVAPDAQIMVMKVFGQNGGAYDSDYMRAIEDAIVLGADSVNLSLGGAYGGMSQPVVAAYRQIFDNLEHCGVVVSISAGNNGYWAEMVENEVPYLYLDDVATQTGGSPGSFQNSLGVASVNNAGFTNLYLEVNGNVISYTESTEYGNEPIASIGGEYEYVFLNDIGTPAQFAALNMDLTGKVVMCYRGQTSFYEKANAAVACGAAAVIIVNNEPGTLGLNLTGYNYTAPVVCISQLDGELFKNTDDENAVCWTGTMTISDSVTNGMLSDPYYSMSIFSSWGVPGDLSMKPEITAPGGNIYAVGGAWNDGEGIVFGDHASYENMSGTSMAAPQVAGMAALMAQYIRENDLDTKTGLDARTLAQSLLMSTAEPILDGNNGGYYYPILQQGAGLANIGNAIMADSYILMGEDATDSWSDGKVKVELGDDPNRTGTYTFSFTIHNLTDEERTYALYSDFFTQGLFPSYDTQENMNLYMDNLTMGLNHSAVWTVDGQPIEGGGEMLGMDFNGDGIITAADGQALLDYATGVVEELANAENADLNGDGKANSYDAYLFFSMLGQCGATVAANGKAEISVTVTLSAEDMEVLDYYYTAGAFVEGYVYAETIPTEEGVAGTCHSIPVLGFYGNWTDPSMYDKWDYTDSIHEEGVETRLPYLTESGDANGFYYNDGTGNYYFGGNPLITDDVYMPERDAINGQTSYISGVGFTAIRNAAAGFLYYPNADGTISFLQMPGNIPDLSDTAIFGAFNHPSGGWQLAYNSLGFGLPMSYEEGSRVEIGTVLVPEYYISDEGGIDLDSLGEGAFFSVGMTIDNTAPIIDLDSIQYNGTDHTFSLSVQDNQYVAGVVILDSMGEEIMLAAGSDPNAQAGDTTQFTLDATGADGLGYIILTSDYAGNMDVVYWPGQIGEVTDTVSEVTVTPETTTMLVGGTMQLSATVLPMNATDRTYTWSSSDEDVVRVDEYGTILAVNVGTADIIATSTLDPTVFGYCTVQVNEINKNLNGIVWDENGAVYFSEFNTKTLPEYNKLSGDMRAINDYLASATVGPNGTLYASSLDTDDMTGYLYTIDPTTYEATPLSACSVQGLHIFYSDLTYAPTMFGTGMLVGSYGPYMIVIEPTTGTAIGILDEYPADIVGIASIGGVWNPNMEAYQDGLLFILADGTVYMDYYFTDAQYNYYGAYYNDYMGGRNGFSSGVDKSGAWYYNSAYFDGEYLFWSAFNLQTYEEYNFVDLYAIDVMGSGATYHLGQFPEGVWPVGGLYEAADVATTTASIEAVDGIALTKQTMSQSIELKKMTNAQDNLVAQPMSGATVTPAERNVIVDITAQGGEGVSVDSHNGVIRVTYDAETYTLKNVVVHSQYESVKKEDGVVTIGYVDLDGIAADEVVASLVLTVKADAVSEIDVQQLEVNDQIPEYNEPLDPSCEHQNTELRNEKTPDCDDKGHTGDLYCTDCGRLLEAGEEIPENGHEMGDWTETKAPDCDGKGEETRKCAKCDHVETREIPATGHDYKDVVTKPTTKEEGYTTHTCTKCGDSFKDTYTEKLPVDPDNSDTGESVNVALWTTVLLVSVTGMAVLVMFRKKLSV